MKLGLDFHGVIDKYPFLAIELSNYITLKKLGEVHIITGVPYSEEKEAELLNLNMGRKWWTNYFSIEDSLIEKEADFEIINGSKYFKSELWNSEKAIYCQDNGIDLHIDDSEEYLEHFTTPYFLLNDQSPKH